jgi:5-formyltetrahydrofolate cyclo-ligase
MPEAIKAAKLKKRGQTITIQKGNLVTTAWKDKKMVTYSSTNCDPTQQRIVQRRQKDGTRQDVPAPVAAAFIASGIPLQFRQTVPQQ